MEEKLGIQNYFFMVALAIIAIIIIITMISQLIYLNRRFKETTPGSSEYNWVNMLIYGTWFALVLGIGAFIIAVISLSYSHGYVSKQTFQTVTKGAVTTVEAK